MFVFHSFCVHSILFPECNLSWVESGHRGSVPHRLVPRPPGGSMGRHQQPGNGAEAAGCWHPRFRTHAQIWSLRTRKQVLHKSRIGHWSLQCSRRVWHTMYLFDSSALDLLNLVRMSFPCELRILIVLLHNFSGSINFPQTIHKWIKNINRN